MQAMLRPTLLPFNGVLPRRNKAPPHTLSLALAVLVEYSVDGGRGADIVADARIHCRLVEREPVQRDDLFPGQLVGSAPTHGCGMLQYSGTAMGINSRYVFKHLCPRSEKLLYFNVMSLAAIFAK